MVHRDLGKICTSIGVEDCTAMAAKAKSALALGSDMVEFRIDKLSSGTPAATIGKKLGRFAKTAIFTVRSKEEGGGFVGNEEERLELISEIAKRLKPAYMDIELATAKEHAAWFKRLSSAASRPGKIILSWHDFGGTPELEVLRQVRLEEGRLGDLAKIVTMAKSPEDSLKLLMLYQERPQGLIAFCMGAEGTASRVLSLQLGSPVVYASMPGEPVAPGQLSVVTMRTLKTMMGGKQERDP